MRVNCDTVCVIVSDWRPERERSSENVVVSLALGGSAESVTEEEYFSVMVSVEVSMRESEAETVATSELEGESISVGDSERVPDVDKLREWALDSDADFSSVEVTEGVHDEVRDKVGTTDAVCVGLSEKLCV